MYLTPTFFGFPACLILLAAFIYFNFLFFRVVYALEKLKKKKKKAPSVSHDVL